MNFHAKRKKLGLGPKKLYLGLWVGMLKNYCQIWNQKCVIWPFWEAILKKTFSHLQSASLNLPYCKVWGKKQKSLNLGPKVSDFRILGLEFENIIVTFEASVLEFVLTSSLVQK